MLPIEVARCGVVIEIDPHPNRATVLRASVFFHWGGPVVSDCEICNVCNR